MAVLATGFGKSLLFQVLAIIELAICPLKSIIRDQIDEAVSLGLNAVELESPDMFENFPRLPDIVFALAEAVGADGFRGEKPTGCSFCGC